MKKYLALLFTGIILSVPVMQGCSNTSLNQVIAANTLKSISSIEYTYSCGLCMGQPSEVITVNKEKITLQISYNDKKEFEKVVSFSSEEFITLSDKLNLNELNKLPEDITLRAEELPTDGPYYKFKVNDGQKSKEVSYTSNVNQNYNKVIADFSAELRRLRQIKFSDIPAFHKQT